MGCPHTAVAPSATAISMNDRRVIVIASPVQTTAALKTMGFSSPDNFSAQKLLKHKDEVLCRLCLEWI
jgi:hypothetical protein